VGVKEQGLEHSRDRYMVVPRTLIFLTHGDCVLLLKGAPNKKIYPSLYNGVGGHIERHETVIQAARREIKEETGLTEISNLALRGIINIATDDDTTGIMLFVFTGQVAHTETFPSREGKPEWIDWYEHDHSQFARYWYDEHDQLQIAFSEEQ